jgi:hypothetical protein
LAKGNDRPLDVPTPQSFGLAGGANRSARTRALRRGADCVCDLRILIRHGDRFTQRAKTQLPQAKPEKASDLR